MPPEMVVAEIPSPIGPLFAAADDDAIRWLEFARPAPDGRPMARPDPGGGPIEPPSSLFGHPCAPGRNPLIDRLRRELEEYFAGRRRVFEGPIRFSGTEFQERVWNALLTIPYGETRSYLDIAKRLGDPKAVRAVGAANGSNPISIVVPCHRVIGSNGSIVGYGGGLPRKTWLLAHERGERPLF